MRLVLHIGAGKCGSSAIQSYLARNAPALRNSGILVPDTNLDTNGEITGQQVWVFQDTLSAASPSTVVRAKFAALTEQMSSANLHTVVVSAENLTNEGAFARACAPAAEIFDDIQIVSYIRRQDDYLISAWCQWWFKIHASFGDYMASARHAAHWARLLAPWDDVFGSKHITVRLFQSGNLINNDIVDDFVKTAGIPQDGCTPNPWRANVTSNEILVEIAHDIREIFVSVHDYKFLQLATNILGESAVKNHKGSTLLSLQERLEIMSYYDDCNKEIRQRYFSDLPADQPLFREPSVEDVVTLSTEQKARMRELLMLQLLKGLTRMAQEDKRAQVHQTAAAEPPSGAIA
jgi:hypothetical protein